MILSSVFSLCSEYFPWQDANIGFSGTEESETMPTKKGVRQATGW
jgi:hypothetical protein